MNLKLAQCQKKNGQIQKDNQMVSVPGAVNRINFFKGDIYVIVESHKNGTVKMRKKCF